MPGHLVLLCGLPGSGKTTRARSLAATTDALRLCEDEWLDDLGFDLFDENARAALQERFWSLTKELLAAGVVVILESGFWTRAERDEKRNGARSLGATVELHFLDVPTDELWARIERRNAEIGRGMVEIRREHLEGWLPRFDPPQADELALFDGPPPA